MSVRSSTKSILSKVIGVLDSSDDERNGFKLKGLRLKPKHTLSKQLSISYQDANQRRISTSKIELPEQPSFLINSVIEVKLLHSVSQLEFYVILQENIEYDGCYSSVKKKFALGYFEKLITI